MTDRYKPPSQKVSTPVILVDPVTGEAYTELPVSAAAGAATEAKQDDIIDALDKLLTSGVAINQSVFGTTNAFYLAGVNVGGAQLVKAEDTVHVSGDVGVMILGVRANSPTLLATEGDYTTFLIDAAGAIWIAGAQIEDAAHVSGDRGHFVLAVRNDAGTALAATDGDYIGFTTDARGHLWVAGSQVEDAAHTSGDRGVMALGVRTDTAAALAGTTGDYMPFIFDSLGKLWVTGTYLEDAAHASDDKGLFVLGIRKDTPTALAGADGDYQGFIFGSDGSLWVAGLVSTVPGDPSASVTRVNDTNAYLANDVIGAATGSTAAIEFTSIGPSAGSIRIIGAELRIDATAAISGETSYRLHLYSVTPPGAYGDNTAWDLPSGDRASYLGYLDLGSPLDLGSTLYVQSEQAKDIKLAGTSVFAYLVTLGAYTPTASRVYTVKLHAVAK